MKKPRVRSAGSVTATTNAARIATEDELKVVTGGDGVLNTKLPQLRPTPQDANGVYERDW